MSDLPPADLPRYRLLTGKDDASFCRRVSEALALGWKLHAAPHDSLQYQAALALLGGSVDRELRIVEGVASQVAFSHWDPRGSLSQFPAMGGA